MKKIKLDTAGFSWDIFLGFAWTSLGFFTRFIEHKSWGVFAINIIGGLCFFGLAIYDWRKTHKRELPPSDRKESNHEKE